MSNTKTKKSQAKAVWSCGIWNSSQDRMATQQEAFDLCEAFGLVLDWNAGDPLVSLSRPKKQELQESGYIELSRNGIVLTIELP